MKILLLTLLFLQVQLSAQELAVTNKGDTVILFNDGTWKTKEKAKPVDSSLMNRIRSFAKQYSASKSDIEIAYHLASTGWTYTLPRPKSNQARWGNSDGRTTWWYGYWYNSKTHQYSQTMPKKSNSGLWLGDNQNLKGNWRNGGSPKYPNAIERILSEL